MAERVVAVALTVTLAATAACGERGGGAGTDAPPPSDDATTDATDTGATADDDTGDTGDGEEAGAGEAPATTDSPAAPATPPLTRPDWLGTRVLEEGAPPPPTPPELDPRRLPTVDHLPPPADGAFHASVAPVPPEVVARSTWQEACPVTLDELRYVTVSFWGFDDLPHTGELLLHRDVADAVAGVFGDLFAARFPIEDMYVTPPAELDAPNTGDGNATAAFVCRPTRGSSHWSEHAYGLAIDINPFHNPYVRDGSLIPGLAATYADRADVRPGMLVPGEGPIEAFAAIGWEWGGAWSNPIDYMHLSVSGR